MRINPRGRTLYDVRLSTIKKYEISVLGIEKKLSLILT